MQQEIHAEMKNGNYFRFPIMDDNGGKNTSDVCELESGISLPLIYFMSVKLIFLCRFCYWQTFS
ncbi:conserved hypothetical protein [Xenorhabdus szentirmaii DSM 16338]|uniref:Uncharacterized protein n=1 Tax=Xenorhabdus szentirmaii DSM 16338 TaxID=1427518 RepID=W1ITG7_9GAMM|nr:conserved hypothetical protein [Xenorhabdus szentirmaii DSM 16338]